jgi:hypothetical protein
MLHGGVNGRWALLAPLARVADQTGSTRTSTLPTFCPVSTYRNRADGASGPTTTVRPMDGTSTTPEADRVVPVGPVPRGVLVVGLAVDERDELAGVIEPEPHHPAGHALAAELVADRQRDQRRRPPDPVPPAEPLLGARRRRSDAGPTAAAGPRPIPGPRSYESSFLSPMLRTARPRCVRGARVRACSLPIGAPQGKNMIAAAPRCDDVHRDVPSDARR